MEKLFARMFFVHMFFVLSIIMAMTMSCFGQLNFPPDRYSQYSTVTMLSPAEKADTAYTSYVYIPQSVRDVLLYANVTKASISDSLQFEVYQSADASAWYKTNTISGISTTGLTRLLLQNAGRYMKIRYYVMGDSSKFTFSLKAVPK